MGVICASAARWAYAEYALTETRARYSKLYKVALDRCPDALIVTVKLAR